MGLWLAEGSGWTTKSIDGHYINIVKWSPLSGSSYIELPKELKHSRKGLINLINKGNECFRWSHVRYLYPQKDHVARIKRSDRKHAKELNYKGVAFPVKVKDYNRIETQNSIRVNVFGYENGKTFPIYVSKEKYERELNLLLIDEHYVLIDDFNRFMFGITKNKDRKYFCMYCLRRYHTEEALNNHKEVCMVINGAQAVKMPIASEKEKWMKFRNYKRQLMALFVIYADFESIVEKVENPKG